MAHTAQQQAQAPEQSEGKTKNPLKETVDVIEGFLDEVLDPRPDGQGESTPRQSTTGYDSPYLGSRSQTGTADRRHYHQRNFWRKLDKPRQAGVCLLLTAVPGIALLCTTEARRKSDCVASRPPGQREPCWLPADATCTADSALDLSLPCSPAFFYRLALFAWTALFGDVVAWVVAHHYFRRTLNLLDARLLPEWLPAELHGLAIPKQLHFFLRQGWMLLAWIALIRLDWAQSPAWASFRLLYFRSHYADQLPEFWAALHPLPLWARTRQRWHAHCWRTCTLLLVWAAFELARAMLNTFVFRLFAAHEGHISRLKRAVLNEAVLRRICANYHCSLLGDRLQSKRPPGSNSQSLSSDLGASRKPLKVPGELKCDDWQKASHSNAKLDPCPVVEFPLLQHVHAYLRCVQHTLEKQSDAERDENVVNRVWDLTSKLQSILEAKSQTGACKEYSEETVNRFMVPDPTISNRDRFAVKLGARQRMSLWSAVKAYKYLRNHTSKFRKRFELVEPESELQRKELLAEVLHQYLTFNDNLSLDGKEAVTEVADVRRIAFLLFWVIFQHRPAADRTSSDRPPASVHASPAKASHPAAPATPLASAPKSKPHRSILSHLKGFSLGPQHLQPARTLSPLRQGHPPPPCHPAHVHHNMATPFDTSGGSGMHAVTPVRMAPLGTPCRTLPPRGSQPRSHSAPRRRSGSHRSPHSRPPHYVMAASAPVPLPCVAPRMMPPHENCLCYCSAHARHLPATRCADHGHLHVMLPAHHGHFHSVPGCPAAFHTHALHLHSPPHQPPSSLTPSPSAHDHGPLISDHSSKPATHQPARPADDVPQPPSPHASTALHDQLLMQQSAQPSNGSQAAQLQDGGVAACEEEARPVSLAAGEHHVASLKLGIPLTQDDAPTLDRSGRQSPLREASRPLVDTPTGGVLAAEDSPAPLQPVAHHFSVHSPTHGVLASAPAAVFGEAAVNLSPPQQHSQGSNSTHAVAEGHTMSWNDTFSSPSSPLGSPVGASVGAGDSETVLQPPPPLDAPGDSAAILHGVCYIKHDSNVLQDLLQVDATLGGTQLVPPRHPDSAKQWWRGMVDYVGFDPMTALLPRRERMRKLVQRKDAEGGSSAAPGDEAAEASESDLFSRELSKACWDMLLEVSSSTTAASGSLSTVLKNRMCMSKRSQEGFPPQRTPPNAAATLSPQGGSPVAEGPAHSRASRFSRLSMHIDDHPRGAVGPDAVSALSHSAAARHTAATNNAVLPEQVLVSLPEFIKALERAFVQRQHVSGTMDGSDTALSYVNYATVVVKWVVVGYIGLTLWAHRSATDAIWALSGLVVVLAFVFGRTLAAAFENASFLLANHPFDVGDRVVLDGEAHVYLVSKVQVPYVNFIRFPDEVFVKMPLETLRTRTIINLSRTRDGGIKYDERQRKEHAQKDAEAGGGKQKGTDAPQEVLAGSRPQVFPPPSTYSQGGSLPGEVAAGALVASAVPGLGAVVDSGGIAVM